MNAEFWNQRYGLTEYVYGTTPNTFFAEQLAGLPPGRLLMPADGEGRNGVYAATLGWDVSCFDLSQEGQHKARNLAREMGVSIDYRVGELMSMDYPPASFDAIGLTYVHFPAELRQPYHLHLAQWLKPGGRIILEAFSQDQLRYKAQYNSGGPPVLEMLYTPEMVEGLFSGFEVVFSEQKEVELREGAFHEGLASVVRYVGIKPAV
ncbi:MAG: class I SAM-dependent methyltransferase [Bacteroidota bacterium]